jgi:hypothetical protein
MTDAQILTLALAVIIPLSMLINSNTRLNDVKETLRAVGEDPAYGSDGPADRHRNVSARGGYG